MGCTQTSDPETRFSNPLGTVMFVSEEERGSAPLKVDEFQPPENYIGPAIGISLLFNEAINEDSLDKFLWIGDENRNSIRYKYFIYDILDSPQKLLEIMPLDTLHPGKQYILHVEKELTSILGVEMEKEQHTKFIFSESNVNALKN
jgi:hypothetical protein